MIIQYYSSVSVYWDIRSGCACLGLTSNFVCGPSAEVQYLSLKQRSDIGHFLAKL